MDIGYELPPIQEYTSLKGFLCAIMYIFFSIFFVLDICCQHLGNVCPKEGFCAHFLINIFVLDICCQHFGNICHLEGFCAQGREI